MVFCQSCGVPISSGTACPACAAKSPAQQSPAAVGQSLIPLVQALAMKPFEAIRSVMNNSDITLAILLLAGVVAVKVLARTIWWGITPNAVFGLKSALASWAGTLVYIGAWAGALTFLAHRRDLRAEFGRVLTGVAAVWVIPTLAIAIVTITPPSLRTAVGILYAVDNVFTWLGLFSVARVLTQHDDSAAFRLILFSALAARAVSIVWGAIF